MNSPIEVAIIGAGFAGIGAAIQLLKANRRSFLIFERATEPGGTWRDNTYPGCACDVPSYLYSFSFAPNPNWSHIYSSQPEILSYLNQCVRDFQLEPFIRFNTEIVQTRFIAETGYWELTTRMGEQFTARVVITAVGPLNRPNVPRLKGLKQFEGKVFHSAQWDHSYNLSGKRVAVIGTGASAIQVIPELAKQVSQLYVFQRTAPYVVPRLDHPVSPRLQSLFRQFPQVQRLIRSGIFWISELSGLGFLGNAFIRKRGTKRAITHLHNQLSDPELRRKATPDYEFGCKRVLVSNDYYPALCKPTVDLITEPIAELTPTSIRTNDGIDRPVDAIVFSTGFLVAGSFLELNITGLRGRKLVDEWLQTGVEAYKGLTASGYPNLLFLVGPNTGLGHNSIVHMIESQLNYVLHYLSVLDKAGAGAFLDVKTAVQQAYNQKLQERMQTTVWASGCQSWYLDTQGKNATIWPGLNTPYRRETRHVNLDDYEVVKRQFKPVGVA